MERLPQELLQKIAKSLPRRELFNVRLVNRSLASASAPFLFAVISLWLGLESLESLNSISEHPQLCQYVKTIVCSTLRFIDYKSDGPAPECHIRDWLGFEIDSSSVQALGVERYMSAYNRFIGNQRYLSKDKLDVKILAKAMRRLNKLESIEVGWNNPYIGSNEIIRSFGMFRGDRLISFGGVHFMPVLFQALAASNTKLRRLLLGHSDLLDYQENTRTLSDIAQPLLPPLGSPTLNKSLITTLAPQALTALVHHPNFNSVSKVMRSLYEFSFQPNAVIDSNDDDLMDMMPSLSQLIALSKSLKAILVTSVLPEDYEIDVKFPMVSLVPPTLEPLLEKLELTDVEASSAELTQMLTRHAQTLVDIQMIYSTITDADWHEVITQLRAIEFKSLKYFTVPDACWDSIEVHNYILRKTERNPLAKTPTEIEE